MASQAALPQNFTHHKQSLSLTKASTYKTQHCCPDVIDNDLRSTADLLLQALCNILLSSEDSSSPPRPSNFGEAWAELRGNK